VDGPAIAVEATSRRATRLRRGRAPGWPRTLARTDWCRATRLRQRVTRAGADVANSDTVPLGRCPDVAAV